MNNECLGIILGGGIGTRLFPLTKDRAKPAVPFGGKYRLIDIPMSNCINSNINRIFILTQYNSESLNNHINQTYKFDNFSKGFAEILAAEQTKESSDWFQGTADAVRKSFRHFSRTGAKYAFILSGDHLYKMNLMDILKQHQLNNAQITICVQPVERSVINEFGVLKMDMCGRIIDFVEKPKDEKTITEFIIPKKYFSRFHNVHPKKKWMASMGIYIFNMDALQEILFKYPEKEDFGRNIIPTAISEKSTFSYYFNGYWEDIGTIRTFFNSNLKLLKEDTDFDLFSSESVYTRPRYLPPVKIISSNIKSSLISEGAKIYNSRINNSVIGLRSIIKKTVLEKVYIMGSDFYENEMAISENLRKSIPDIGIGENSYIRNAIIDKNARIGKNCRIENKKNMKDFDGVDYCIRDGIVIIEKNAKIPDNTVI